MKIFPLIVLIVLVFLTAGCSDQIIEEDLIGGKWLATAGFEKEEDGGEPICGYYAHGLEFIDKETVYVEYKKENFKYYLREGEDGTKVIEIYPPRIGIDSYNIYKVSENAFGIVLTFGNFKNGCYFEREK